MTSTHSFHSCLISGMEYLMTKVTQRTLCILCSRRTPRTGSSSPAQPTPWSEALGRWLATGPSTATPAVNLAVCSTPMSPATVRYPVPFPPCRSYPVLKIGVRRKKCLTRPHPPSITFYVRANPPMRLSTPTKIFAMSPQRLIKGRNWARFSLILYVNRFQNMS